MLYHVFFPIRVHLFLSAPSSYAVQPCAHRSLRLGSYSARSSALQQVSVETNLPCEGPADLNQGHYPTRNQMYLFIYVFFRCWNGVFCMYMSCTFNMFVYICISQILLLGFLTTHLAQKNMISVQYYLELVSTKKHNIIKSRQPEKKTFPLVIKPGMELRIFNGTIY